ncbi:PSD1 and planctomycete cytochrome C domain-containing protein [Schlesneria paludicola]|uniref:PSD1 and planctomycete cytochrome C domain-containing protein n=1 Tax=Schlesneria paludicola TaxID=360056 RepID=UPI00029A9352|nr:PSD1 and planctomycete cytochrome C domain-containing protein [Schlesneria paludicola]
MTFERPVWGERPGSGGRRHRRTGFLVLLISAVCCEFAVADDATDLFEAKIRPVLAGTCFRCHGGLKAGGTLHVDSREALLKGGDSGPAIVPGKPDDSLLIQAIKHQDGVSAMPPEKDKTLRPDQIADFVAWVTAGAAWPAKTAAFEFEQHWAFEPVRDAELPAVRDANWPQTSVDRFVLAKLESAGVHAAPRADKLTLIRRVTFDLTGLPPTPDEIDAFVQDSSPQAFETVIERLLKSSAYGERWGRHWLDVVRYADTAGETADYPVRDAWRYRNYVIDSFNADKPYDQFLREQIAGDILAEQGPRERYAERAVATGFLAISRRFGFDSENYHHLTIQDTIDTLGQSVLGLSLGCARCHDHKFDPVSLQDYYGLYGIFESSNYAFPGAEQKQRSRAMMPLLPQSDARQKWTAFDQRVDELVRKLSAQSPTAPPAILRSLDDLDGDFEMQGPAAGGSKGVLVGPWAWSGDISVTASAQSPFKRVYPLGKLGTNLSKNGNEYHVGRAIHPSRTRENCAVLFVNLDFRIASASAGQHRVWIGDADQHAVAELWVSKDGILAKSGDRAELVCPSKPDQWQSLQLMLDLERRELSGRVQGTNETLAIPAQPFATNWSGSIDYIGLNSATAVDSKFPVLEIDNLALQDAPFPTSTGTPAAPAIDLAGLTQQLKQLAGQDGDFESQLVDAAPDVPWTAGPNSVVKIAAIAQSPFQNLFSIGSRGIQMPNRGEYDGYGQVLATDWKPESTERLYASVDFCCASDAAGGMGSWRFYLGHGPGVSAAVELFFNGHEITRRSGDARDVVRPLRVGEWYQLQLSLNLKEKTYSGVISSFTDRTEFTGAFATGWDGHLDYTFIDSYGHRPGVRPSLHADNFTISETSLSPTNASPIAAAGPDDERRTKVVEVRAAIKGINQGVESARQELTTLFTEGPCEMAYGVVEGTPRNARIQIRGEPDQPGAEVSRGFIKVLGGGTLPTEAKGSGRLELAQWITRADNPLTSRVMANRIWQNHFGTGLVKTSNDFGVRGLKPTHPELLDHLAQEFVRGGWSIKNLHRLILRSATYQQAGSLAVAALAQGTNASASNESPAVSPDWLASFPRRRLSAEEIRDSILAISGELDATPGKEHPFPPPASWGYSQHGPFNAVYDHDRRSIYLMTQRLKRHPFLGLFDGADPNTTTAIRTSTTVPTQSLFFLNDPFVHAKAGKSAERLRSAISDESGQVERAVRLVLGRQPTGDERADATEFLQAYRTELVAAGQDKVEERALAAYVRTLFGSNEFLHVD